MVENWVRPLAAMLGAAGVDAATARTVARLGVAVSRGLLLDVPATGQDEEVAAAMALFSQMLLARIAVHSPGTDPQADGAGPQDRS